MKWAPLKFEDLLRLLQHVESSWKTLAGYLLKDNLQYKIDTIESNSFHDDTSTKALDDVLRKWLVCTVQAKRTWQTLRDAADKYKDGSLENYIVSKSLGCEFCKAIDGAYYIIIQIVSSHVLL